VTGKSVRLVTIAYYFANLVIGIEVDAAGIGIPASNISVLYRSIPVPKLGPLILVQSAASALFFIPVPD
jgi:hypothetical protein